MCPLVSILIPVYNVENYLKQCLDSIINQTYKNLQIVLVDDGSADNSGLICDEIAKKDSRVEVYHKANGGVASARNELLDHIKGEYFLFVDADDWIELDMVEYLIEQTKLNDADIITCEMVKNDDSTSIDKEFISEWSKQKLIYEFLKHTYLNGSLCNKLIKSSLICINGKFDSKIKFDNNISYGEDALFCWYIIQNIEHAVITNRKLYHYRMNPQSISHKNYGIIKQSGDIVWETINRETKAEWPEFLDIAKARWKIENMWQIYFAAKSKYPHDHIVRYFQNEVRENFKLIRQSGLLNSKKIIFAWLACRTYSLTKIIVSIL